MATLQGIISKKFLEHLSDVEEFDAEKIAALRTLLLTSGKPKADDFVAIFSVPPSNVK
jgi:hypothetical protein